jgi:RHS repeat-associated protein
LNRVASGRDATHWRESYTYDNWGNLYQTQQMTGLRGNNWSVTANANNQLSNLSYDSAGEVTTDQLGNTYDYDAEGRLLTAGTGSYVYDGDGNRVIKTVGGTTTLYWPGAGSLLDESNSSGSTMGKQVQFAGLLVWHEDASGNGNFLFHDQLGSIRVTGSASGSLADDNDYQSFGNLWSNYGPSPSDTHYLFTGYESDASESSTDYAVNRNLSTSMGRFNRPDPYDGSYDQTNPQSLNRYSYVGNMPLQSIDPLGLGPVSYCAPTLGESGATMCTFNAEPVDSGSNGGSSGPPNFSRPISLDGSNVPLDVILAPSNATCAGKTVPVGNNIRVQSNSQGMITGVGVVLTGPSGYQSGGSGGYTSIAPNTILGVSLGAGGALNIGLNNPLYFKPGGAGAFTGAYISSATFNNGSFSQVSGAVAFEGIPFGSRYTPSSYLANQFNQNSSLTNVAQLLQSTAQLGQSLVGCSVVVGH